MRFKWQIASRDVISIPSFASNSHALLLTPNAFEQQRHVITQLYQITKKPSYHKWTVITLLDQISRQADPNGCRDSGILYKLANRIRQNFLSNSVCFDMAVANFDPNYREVIDRSNKLKCDSALDPSLNDLCNRVRTKAYIHHAVEADLSSIFALIRQEINWFCINWTLFRDLLTRLVEVIDSTSTYSTLLIDFLESVRTFPAIRNPPASDVWTRVHADEAEAVHQLVNAVSAQAFAREFAVDTTPVCSNQATVSPETDDEDDLEFIASLNETVLSMAILHVCVLTKSPLLPIELRMYIIHYGFQDNTCHFDLSSILEYNSVESNRRLARFILYDSLVYSLKWQQLTPNTLVQKAATTLMFLLNYLDPLVLHEDLRLSYFNKCGAPALSSGLSLIEKMYYILAATDVDLDGFSMTKDYVKDNYRRKCILTNWFDTDQVRGGSREEEGSGAVNDQDATSDSMPSPFDYMILMRELLSGQSRNFFTAEFNGPIGGDLIAD